MSKYLSVLMAVCLIFGGNCTSAKIKDNTQQINSLQKEETHLSGKAPDGKPYNILFIPVDDLNHWIGVLGRNAQVKTPNIDKLAASGETFTNAHCAAPACCPSRAALLSGVRPYTSGVYGNSNDWRTVISKDVTMPTFFKNNGYNVLGGGKIYHGGFDRDEEFTYYYRGGSRSGNGSASVKGGFGGIKWGIMKGGDEDLHDFEVASWAIEELNKKQDKPFFLAAGIFRPHMPWNVPQKYYDMYPLETIVLPPYKLDDIDDMPEEGKKMALAMNDWKAMMKTENPELEWKKAVRAYLACISYADAMIGRVLDGLEKSEYRNNTIVVMWGDHGWHLNEKNHWRKFSLWEEATRAPLLYRVPGITKAGSVCKKSVDFMSIYPTLAQLCGFEIPKHIEGVSIVPLLKNSNAEWKIPAVITHGFNNHAIRTEKWRYIAYNNGGEELYDEENDKYEWKNLAGDGKYKEVIKELKNYIPAKNKPAIQTSKGGNDGE